MAQRFTDAASRTRCAAGIRTGIGPWEHGGLYSFSSSTISPSTVSFSVIGLPPFRPETS